MKICKDGRIWGQNNKEAGDHLGAPTDKPYRHGRMGTASSSKLGSKNPMFGKKRDMNKGCNNPNWKGGISPLQQKDRKRIEYKLWRQAVFARDNWTCHECGKRGGIHAHHVKPFSTYPELRFAIDNGITLCYKCHRLKHSNGNGRSKDK